MMNISLSLAQFYYHTYIRNLAIIPLHPIPFLIVSQLSYNICLMSGFFQIITQIKSIGLVIMFLRSVTLE